MNVSQRVKQFIVENFFVSDPASIGEDTSLIAEGIVDSTGMLEVITFLEGEFGIVVADDETTPDNLETVGRITAFVGRKQLPATGTAR
jgi:acyl carrier protein